MLLLKRFFNCFSKYKKIFIFYSVISVFIGFLELGGVALTYPFLYDLIPVDSQNSGLTRHSIELGIIIISLFLAKNLIMIFYTYFQVKLVKFIEKDITIQFLRYFLSASYKVSSQIPFAKKMNILGFKIPKTINEYILRVQNLTVNSFIFVFLVLFIICKFPFASVIVLICATILFLIQKYCYVPIMNVLGIDINNSSYEYSKKVNETLINIKSIKTSHKELYFFNKYNSAIKKYYKNICDTQFFNAIPPYITEPTVITLLFILIAVIMCQNANSPQVLIASLGAIIAAIFRLTPTISRIQVNINGISSAKKIVEDLLEMYEKLDIKNITDLKSPKFSDFNDYMELRNVNFSYETNKPVLKNINLRFNKGEFIGIVGLSGAGKTTLADIIAGLLDIDSGEYIVDGENYSNPLKIGYITQEYGTIAGTIRENVAFAYDDIDDEKVVKALKDAQLYDFVVNNYENGIYANPFVDSTGFSLGQRQRLAIARTLYIEPDIIIMDEATSSLDLKTEDNLCKILLGLKGEKTIIAIAHRLSTIKAADKIVYLKNGTVENVAPFSELVKISSDFNELVKLTSLNEH